MGKTPEQLEREAMQALDESSRSEPPRSEPPRSQALEPLRETEQGELVEAESVTTAEPEVLAAVDDVPPVDPDEDPGVALMRIVGNAVASAQPIEVIERLLVVHERYEAGVARKQYAAAMAALRGELPEVVKTETVSYKAKGGQVHYRHENLANMIENLSPVMARHGLSFRWKTDTTIPESIQVTCVVTHEAGHSEEASLSGPPDTSGSKNVIQAIASTVSYLQRYTLKAAIGIAAGKDDDGAGGAPAQEPIQQPRAQGQAEGEAANGPGDVLEVGELHQVIGMFPANRSKTISPNQIGRLRNLAQKAGWTVEAVDDEIARVLSMRTSEIPSIGDGYEAVVRFFQTHKPSP